MINVRVEIELGNAHILLVEGWPNVPILRNMNSIPESPIRETIEVQLGATRIQNGGGRAGKLVNSGRIRVESPIGVLSGEEGSALLTK